MKLKTSFFDPTLLKKNIGRFAPAWALLLFAQFLAVPMTLLHARTNQMRRLIEEDALACGIALSFICAIVFAGLLFKYLHKARTAYMMHAFPMTRSCMFLTNAVSGLLFWLIPSLITTLINFLILADNHIYHAAGLAFGMLGQWMLMYLCFYGIAVFALMLSGSTIISVISYGALNFVFYVLPVLFLALVKSYTAGLLVRIPRSVSYLAPLAGIISSIDSGTEALWLWIYAAVGLALIVLAWVHYLHRHVERAGDAMVYGWSRIAFRVVFTASCTLGLGWILEGIFDDEAYLLYALLGCVLGWFLSTMMVERTVKVFQTRKNWIGCGIGVLALLLLVGGMYYDVLGWQRQVPETEKVESVEIWTYDDTDYDGNSHSDRITLTEKDDVDLIREIHENTMKNSREVLPDRDPYRSYYYDRNTIYIRYHLAGGGTLTRAYEWVSSSDCNRLAELYTRPDVCAAWYAENLPTKFTSVRLCYEETVDYYTQTAQLPCKDPAALRDAILADAAAGRLYIYNYLTTGCDYYYNEWRFISDAYLELRLEQGADDYNEAFVIPITNEAAQTLALFGISSLTELNDRKISLDSEQSRFIGSEIRGDQVYLSYKLTFNNESVRYQHGRLWASFPEGAGTLVMEDRLPGYRAPEEGEALQTDHLMEDIMDLDFGQTELEVVFVGTYAGGTQKHDLPLPELHWYPFEVESYGYEYGDEEIIIPIQ